MDFQTFYPVSELLKRHIDYYYFFNSDDPDFRRTYYSFPNTSTAINIHQNVCAEIRNGLCTRISGAGVRNRVVIASRVISQPFKVEWQGQMDKVTIVFKPLGLNHFISEPFAQLMPEPVCLFTGWAQKPGYDPFLNDFYGTADLSARVACIETFLLSCYAPFPELAVLERAMLLLSDLKNILTSGEIAARLGLSERTFNRLFARHTGMTPMNYRKITRFRNSLKNKLFGEQFRKLTDIAYANHFYDQSYFWRIYQQLSGSSPKDFFNSVAAVADEQLILQFIQ